MVMLRLNVPSVFMYGGRSCPVIFEGKDVDVVNVFEAVGKHASGEFSDADLKLECVACPSAGACGGNLQPIRWHVYLKPLDWLYLIQQALLLPTRVATLMQSPVRLWWN